MSDHSKLIIFLYENGTKVSDISAKLKISKAAVYKILRNHRMVNYRKDVDNALYSSEKYLAWRNAVLERDGYRCIVCGKGKEDGVILQVDHYEPKSIFPEKMFDVNNGRTLCLFHHRSTKSWGKEGIKNYTKENKL